MGEVINASFGDRLPKEEAKTEAGLKRNDADGTSNGGGPGGGMLEARVTVLEHIAKSVDKKLDELSKLTTEIAALRLDVTEVKARVNLLPDVRAFGELKGAVDSMATGKEFGELKGRVSRLPTTPVVTGLIGSAVALLTLAIAVITRWSEIRAFFGW